MIMALRYVNARRTCASLAVYENDERVTTDTRIIYISRHYKLFTPVSRYKPIPLLIIRRVLSFLDEGPTILISGLICRGSSIMMMIHIQVLHQGNVEML